MTIREEASAILGVRIEKDNWDTAFARLDVGGKLTKKVMLDLMLMMLKRIEIIEENGNK